MTAQRDVHNETSPEAKDKLYVGQKFCFSLHEYEKKDLTPVPLVKFFKCNFKERVLCLARDTFSRGSFAFSILYL